MGKCTSIKIPATMLRRVAQAADGMREKDFYFVISERAFQIVDAEPSSPPANSIVIKCHTENRVNRPVPRITVTAPNSLPKEIAGADALFWSESAMEKFLLPYYASLAGVDAIVEVARLTQAYLDSDVYGLVHLPKSDYVPQELTASGTTKTRLDDFFGVLVEEEGELKVHSLTKFKAWKAAAPPIPAATPQTKDHEG